MKPDIFCPQIAKMPSNYKNSTQRQSWRQDNIEVEMFLILLIIMKRNIHVYTLKTFFRDLDPEEDGKLMALGLQFLDIYSQSNTGFCLQNYANNYIEFRGMPFCSYGFKNPTFAYLNLKLFNFVSAHYLQHLNINFNKQITKHYYCIIWRCCVLPIKNYDPKTKHHAILYILPLYISSNSF